MENGTVMTLDDCEQMTFPELMCGALDSPAKTSALPEISSDSEDIVAVCFTQLCDLYRTQRKKIDPQSYLLRMLKTYLVLMGGGDFLKVLIELDEAGYDAEWQVINSADYVPQNRERVFVIGHLRGRGGREVFPVETADRKNRVSIIGHRDGYRRNSQTYSPEGITEALDTGTGGGRNFNVVQPMFCDLTSGSGMIITETARCLKARYDSGVTNRCGECFGVAVPVLTPDREHKRQNGRRMKEDGEPMFSLTAQDRHGVLIGIDDYISFDGVYLNDSKRFSKPPLKNQSRCLKSEKHDAGVQFGLKNGDFAYSVLCEKYGCYVAIRKLTPKECFRLQGWEDAYFDRAALVNSDSQLYKQAGNGVTVPVIYEIARRFND